MSDKSDEGTPVFARAARGDGSGVITIPAEMQEDARKVVLDNWTEWSLGYLWKCGHHPAELEHVAPSLRRVLAEWWDARNSFDRPEDHPRFFERGWEWNAFWKPSTTSINDLQNAAFQKGLDEGWDQAMNEFTAWQEAKRPTFCERIAAMFRRKTGPGSEPGGQ